LTWGRGAVEAEEVCSETDNVRSSYESSVDGVSLPVIPSGNNAHPGSPDINGGTIIGEVDLPIAER